MEVVTSDVAVLITSAENPFGVYTQDGLCPWGSAVTTQILQIIQFLT